MRASVGDAVDGRLWARCLRLPVDIELRLDIKPEVLPLSPRRLALGPAREELNLRDLHPGVPLLDVHRRWPRLARPNALAAGGPRVAESRCRE